MFLDQISILEMISEELCDTEQCWKNLFLWKHIFVDFFFLSGLFNEYKV